MINPYNDRDTLTHTPTEKHRSEDIPTYTQRPHKHQHTHRHILTGTHTDKSVTNPSAPKSL